MSTLAIDSFFQAYGSKDVLKGVFLRMEQGRIAGLLGPNGSGKTTLFSCVQGTLARKSGSLFIDGVYIAPKDAWKHFAVLSQISFLPPHLGLDKAARLFAGPGILKADSWYCRDSFIAPLRKGRVANLSGGERRYLETVLVCSLGRPFVILDEPFSEIEPLHIPRLFELFRSLLPEMGFLLTDHQHQSVRDIADDLYVMANGQVQACPNDDKALRAWGYFPEVIAPAADQA